MEKIIIFILLFSFLVFGIWVISLFDENLHKKFTNIGVFNYKKYNDFINEIREPDFITHQNSYIIAQWCTNNNFTQNYNIVLVFDKRGNFIKKHNEVFSSANPPKIWVGVRI